MLTRIEASNFRSLRSVAQDVSSFHTLVGPNGSGKTSFLDVIGFLGDMLRVGPFKAIVGDGQSVHQRAADPQHLCWLRRGGTFELAVELQIPEDRLVRYPEARPKVARYEVRFEVAPQPEGPQGVRLAVETLWLLDNSPRRESAAPLLFPSTAPAGDAIVVEPGRHAPKGWKKVVSKAGESGNDQYKAETSGWGHPFRLGPGRSALANLPEDEEKFPVAIWVKRMLMEGVRKVVLNAEAMRMPGAPGSPTHYLPDGSNLPWVVDSLERQQPDRFRRWVEHVRTALPDLQRVTTFERPEDRHRAIVVHFENGLIAPSWLLSDGTLRLLALTLIAFLPKPEGIYLIEEPENGIHPRAIETVFQSLTSVYGAQVLCASHSPVVLALSKPEQLLCFAKDENGATDIVRGDRHPGLGDWRGGVDLGTLFAAGVLG